MRMKAAKAMLSIAGLLAGLFGLLAFPLHEVWHIVGVVLSGGGIYEVHWNYVVTTPGLIILLAGFTGEIGSTLFVLHVLARRKLSLLFFFFLGHYFSIPFAFWVSGDFDEATVFVDLPYRFLFTLLWALGLLWMVIALNESRSTAHSTRRNQLGRENREP